MRINTNLPALTAFNSLRTTNNSLSKVISSLATGLRINSAADDAAGLAVSEKMRSQVSGLDTSIRNSQDGISLLQTAEGALGETNSILQRMRELAVQASNDTLTSQDRSYIQLEIDQLRDQIDRIANTTQFNKKRLLDGSCGAVWSSSDDGLKAKIRGGLEYIDSTGRKVSSEGNYRIDVTAEPGQAQVQKSNILGSGELGIATEETIIRTEIVKKWEIVGYRTEYRKELVGYGDPEEYSIDISKGVDPTGKTSGDGWYFSGGTLTITKSGKYSIVGDTTPTANNIIIQSGVTATIFMKDVNIDVSSQWSCAFNISGATVDMYLEGQNTMTSGGHFSGINVPSSSKLTINSISGDYSTDGNLTANGALHGAGIGGSCSGGSQGGTIIIKGGTIEAQGGNEAAGIGGGSIGYNPGAGVSQIIIEGGDVTARGGIGGAGIGTGASKIQIPQASSINNSKITIKGGLVQAYGGAAGTVDGYNYPQGAGIGGGGTFNSGEINIQSGLSVTASGYKTIGCGEYGDSSQDNIDLNANFTLDPANTAPDKPTYQPEIWEWVPYQVPIWDDVEHEEQVKEQRVNYTTLAENKIFTNPSGVSITDQPQTITITQGDGKTAEVTLYSTDTMPDIARKINDAVAYDLGQSRYTDNPNKFCTIADGTENTSESVFVREQVSTEETTEEKEVPPDGDIISDTITTSTTKYSIAATMLVRSAVPGKNGELSFSGDDDLLHALGLNTIQESSESSFTASVYDAHSGKLVASNVRASGNEFKGIIPPGIDIEVDPMSGISAKWDEGTKRFIAASKDVQTAYLHLKNNGTVLQTGANQGEDLSIQLGDASSSALNLSSVNLFNREAASRSISIIDRAINTISSQRAKIGAYANALERVMDNLTTTSTNLTDADSRLRDADMAATMMEFVKLQILNQSGTAMLSQANQLPQSVLRLLGN